MYTPNLPYLFYLSAIAAGLAMVSVEGIVSSRGLKRNVDEMPILQGLGRGARITLIIYLVAKIADMTYQGSWPLLFAGTKASFFWSIEMIVGVIVPIVLYSMKTIRESVNGLLVTSGLVLFGVVLNRFDVNFFAQANGSACAPWKTYAAVSPAPIRALITADFAPSERSILTGATGVPGTGVEVKVGSIVAVGEMICDAVAVGAAFWVAATIVAISAGDVPGMSAVAHPDEALNNARITRGVRERRRLGDIMDPAKYTATISMNGSWAM